MHPRPGVPFVLSCLAVAMLGCGGSTSGSRAGLSGTGGADAGSTVVTPDVTVTLDVGVTHQTLVGFGAASVYYTNYLSDRHIANDDIDTVLFSDLGLDVLRIANWYQTQAVSGTSIDTPFTDTATPAIVARATASLGHPPILLMSSWSPPAYLKSTSVTKGTTRGTLARDTAGAFRYPDFATWWVSGLAAYAARGVRPDYISIQNEPDFFNSGWETCLLDPAEGTTNAGYGPALDAVFTRIQTSDLEVKPQIVGPEISGTRRITNYLAGMNAAQIGAVAHHLYNGGAMVSNPDPSTFTTAMTTMANAAATVQRPLFMTEYSPGQPAMLETAGLIDQALTVEGVSAYVYWELFWAPPANGIPTALVTLDNPGQLTSARGYTINDTYYAVKHFAKWTDPGHVRVDAASSNAVVRASAFLAPDASSVTLIVINGDRDNAHGVVIDAGGFAFATATAFRSSGMAERAQEVSFDAGMALTMPPAAIATVILTR